MSHLPKARLAAVFFGPAQDEECTAQLAVLRRLLAAEAEILASLPLGAPLPDADAALLPQVIGEAYQQVNLLRDLHVPLLIATSEFGAASMWDWEFEAYLAAERIQTLAPYSFEQTKAICRALGLKRQLRSTKFLVFQDRPGEGPKSSVPKRFYWWREECIERIYRKFGVTLVRKSFRELGEAARLIPDAAAQATLKERQVAAPAEDMRPQALTSSAKMYLALKQEIDADPSIRAAGMNCLNEAHFSDTTPCLAWDLLYEDQGLTWGCEADIMSMLTQHILHQTLQAPIMMTNLYPFLMGQTALKHERIPRFPAVAEPENCVLAAHCGYLGVLPRPFATEWTLRPKVLDVVGDHSTAIDARLPCGPVTLAKLGPALDSLSVAEAQLERYVQYPGSNCRTGGVIRVRDGHQFTSSLVSHHYLVMTGHHRAALDFVAKVFNLRLDVI